MTRSLAVLLALSLAGCGPLAAWREQQAQITQQQHAQTTASSNAEDDAKCRGWGAAPGSDAYVNCRTKLNVNRQQAAVIEEQSQANRDAAASANGAAIGTAIINSGHVQ